MKNKITLLNVISSVLLQLCNILFTFIVPQIILSYFGSSVNGLISSLTQFLSYISLIEGGITGVITASLYKPLVDNDLKKISSIVKTSDKFYKKIGLIFIIYSFILAVSYPLIFKTNFSFLYVFSLTIILSLNLLIQYMYSLSLKTLLIADKKVYIASFTQIIIIIINLILVIVCVHFYPNVHLLKLICGLLFLIQPIVYSKYIKKHYNIYNSITIDNELIKNRWNGFAINIAAFIHFSTDITILTIFTDLSTVSVYSVYSLVTSGLRTIINSISSGINPTIGQLLASGDDKVTITKFNIYEYIIIFLVFLVFCVSGLLITPFVMIYTSGISDANYYQPIFGVLLLISEALYLIKVPHLNLSYSANMFKEITIPAFVEAALNIVVSLISVKKWGLIGIAIGTIAGMLYRMIFQVEFTKKILKNFKSIDFYKKIIVFILASIVGIIFCNSCISEVQFTILSWIYHAILYFVVFAVLYFIVSLIFYRDELYFLINYMKINKKGIK